jgi:hypothetical protein
MVAPSVFKSPSRHLRGINGARATLPCPQLRSASAHHVSGWVRQDRDRTVSEPRRGARKEYALCVTDVALSPASRHLLVGLQRDIYHDVVEHCGE